MLAAQGSFQAWTEVELGRPGIEDPGSYTIGYGTEKAPHGTAKFQPSGPGPY